MPGKSTRIALAAGLLVCVSAAAARAENTDPGKLQAQAALREGNALLEQGRATDALAKFTEAYRLFASPKIHYNLGQAESLIPGHEAQAYEQMSEFLSQAKDANPDLRAAAETQRRKLRSQVGLVAVMAEPADAALLIDDRNVGKTSPETPAVLGIGTHRLALTLGAAVSAPETLTIAGGETSSVRLRLAPPAASPLVALPPAPPPADNPITTPPAMAAPPGGYWTWQHQLGAGLAGLAVAGLVFGVVEHVRYFGAKDDYKNMGCYTGDPTPSARCEGLKDRFNSANTSWVAGYIGAAVLGGAGAYFLWLAPSARPGGGEGGAVASVNPGMTVNFQGRF